MRIIFTDKLSKMVAQYENFRDKPWAHLTLNDISSQNEVRVSRYLTLKNNKITVEEEQQDRF